jgi:hypothetical protein
MRNDGRPRCRKCGRPLTDPVSIALGLGPVCRGEAAYRPVPPARPARGGRSYSDPLYINTTLFVVRSEPDENDRQRRRALLQAHMPFPCGDITFYPLGAGGWQSSGGSRVFTDDELAHALTEAGMI